MKQNEAEKKVIQDIYDNGRTLCTTCDDEIEENIRTHITDKKFHKSYHSESEENNFSATLGNIREIIKLSKENHINLIFFINPVHQTTYLDTNLKMFFAFKQELAKLTNYYDFSGLNSITTNNYYYYETSHYRPLVANMMVKKMFSSPSIDIPSDFGVIVTSQNIDDHLDNLCKQIKRIDARLNDNNTSFKNTCSDKSHSLLF